MSRIGLSPVTVPDGVTVEISGQEVTAKGKLGELKTKIPDDIEIVRDDNVISVKPRGNSQRTRKMWGLSRSLINNVVTGVGEGFSKELEIAGVGYRAQVQGKDLVLQLGFSHEIRYPVPEGLKIECPEQTKVVISGADKQLIGQTAAEIRKFRPPEPYKGKGVKYAGEYILRKEGKKK
jgi:large subunit ribosomal protein L6